MLPDEAVLTEPVIGSRGNRANDYLFVPKQSLLHLAVDLLRILGAQPVSEESVDAWDE